MRHDKGFTMIEALVAILVVGILAVFGWPSLIIQANKAREAEAQAIVGSANNGQEAFFLEHGRFAATFDQLELAPDSERNYEYKITTGTEEGRPWAIAEARPKDYFRGFIGGVVIAETENGEAHVSVLCDGQRGEVPTLRRTSSRFYCQSDVPLTESEGLLQR